MVNGIIGKKIGMTQVFASDGTVTPVTVIKAGPCVVVQRKTSMRDGYEAVQLGLVEERAPKRVTKPLMGHFGQTEKAKSRGKQPIPPTRILREFRLEASDDTTKVGDNVLVDQFSVNDEVNVVGTSKGRGFAGFVKRHKFGGGRATHGSMFHRAPGSIGASAFPSRVIKGTRMAGHMGVDRKTIKNLQVVQVDAEQHLLLIRGSIPGPNGGYVLIQKNKA
jgi:large subunit ribosomal protein L3